MSVLGEWCIVGMPNYGCVTGAFADGWAELQPAGSLFGDIRFRGGDEISFIARRWTTSSTAC